MGEPDPEIHTVPRDYARRHPEYAAGFTAAQPYLAPDDPRRETMPDPNANQPQSQPPAQGQTQGQPQAAAGQHPAEQQLLQAGASQQHLQQARALGLDPGQLAALLVKLIPLALELYQQFRGGPGSGGQPAPTAAP
jgi:hypothetical protein